MTPPWCHPRRLRRVSSRWSTIRCAVLFSLLASLGWATISKAMINRTAQDFHTLRIGESEKLHSLLFGQGCSRGGASDLSGSDSCDEHPTSGTRGDQESALRSDSKCLNEVVDKGCRPMPSCAELDGVQESGWGRFKKETVCSDISFARLTRQHSLNIQRPASEAVFDNFTTEPQGGTLSHHNEGSSKDEQTWLHPFCNTKFLYFGSYMNNRPYKGYGTGNNLYMILNAMALGVLTNRTLVIGKTEDKRLLPSLIHYDESLLTLEKFRYLWHAAKCKKMWVKTSDEISDGRLARPETKPCRGLFTEARFDLFNISITHRRTGIVPVEALEEIWICNSTFLNIILSPPLPAIHQFSDKIQSTYGLSALTNFYGILSSHYFGPAPEIKQKVVDRLVGNSLTAAVHLRKMSGPPALGNSTWCEEHFQAIRECILSDSNKDLSLFVLSDSREAASHASLYLQTSDNIHAFTWNTSHFLRSYPNFSKRLSRDYDRKMNPHGLAVRDGDWGKEPRWISIVEFFAASKSQLAVYCGGVFGMHTFCQLITAHASGSVILAAAEKLCPQVPSHGSCLQFALPKLVDPMSCKQVNLHSYGHSKEEKRALQ